MMARVQHFTDEDLKQKFGYNPQVDYDQVLDTMLEAQKINDQEYINETLKQIGGYITLYVFITHQRRLKRLNDIK